MNRIVVIGIGNRLMMDDGVGVYIVEELMKKSLNERIRYIVGETDTDYCLSHMNRDEYIVIIDAVNFGEKPGAIKVFSLNKINHNLCHASHDVSLINSLRVFDKDINGILIAIEPEKIGYGYGIQGALKSKMPRIIKRVEKILKKQM